MCHCSILLAWLPRPGPSTHPFEIQGTSTIAMQCLSIFVDHTSMDIKPPKETATHSCQKQYFNGFWVGPCNKNPMKKNNMCPMKTVCFLFRMEPFVFCWFTAKLPMIFFSDPLLWDPSQRCGKSLGTLLNSASLFFVWGSWVGGIEKWFRNFQPFWTILVHWDYILPK